MITNSVDVKHCSVVCRLAHRVVIRITNYYAEIINILRNINKIRADQVSVII